MSKGRRQTPKARSAPAAPTAARELPTVPGAPTALHDAVANKLVAALDRLARAQRKHLQAAATELGLTPLQAELLTVLADGPPPELVVGELARELGVRQPTLTESAAALERKGLIVRSRSLADRRRTHLELTATGHEVVAGLAAAKAEMVKAVAVMPRAERTSTYVSTLGLIRTLVDAGLIDVARTCLTCKFMAVDEATSARHCTLLDMALPDGALRVDCPEHEEAA